MSNWPFLMKWRFRRQQTNQAVYQLGVTRAALRAKRRESQLVRAAYEAGYRHGLIHGQLGLIDREKTLH